ncbi:endonuclease/exonuclease/phosphatase family protein [Siccirubricoccus sp. G192]|uniref:endonuclease/exonuclease/phosphatase family protein n=1 Tax=Siccirubricoccus sp. G192 TaxID=2849651 RepID=UPI001C2C1137|nr:endonuclease/exonuclease/phosphatase family protein [Siccirubricoccus sp. G192]MBV1799304.1 endonuclease/exonuclease/phosphatase family protein [Siccirubricoccus sp. G192]
MRKAISALLLLLAAFAVAPLLAPGTAPPSAATGTELKLATWNLAWLTLRPSGDPALPRDVTPRQPGDFALLAGYASRLDADVIALQEVDGPEAAARVFDPGVYAFFFPREADVQRAGFAVRRGLRVTQNADLEGLDLQPRARHSLRRGTDITVEVAGRRLRLLSIHLKAGCRDAPMQPQQGQDCESLGRQSAVLADWVAARQRGGGGFAVLGDFNRRLGSTEDMMLRELTREAPLTRATEGTSNPCWSGARGGRPFVDHILLGGEARGWWLPDSLRVMVYAERGSEWRDRLSDHCPVSLRLRLP